MMNASNNLTGEEKFLVLSKEEVAGSNLVKTVSAVRKTPLLILSLNFPILSIQNLHL
jgi:hypothetical protein